jgi:urease accessory protein
MSFVPAYVRAQGEIRASFSAEGGRTHIDHLYEAGGLRLRHPNVARGCEAVIVNTGGGVAGGDHALYDFTAEDDSDVVLTTQSAEKIYRAEQDAAEINVSLRLGDRAVLDWVPQETIMFQGARLRRRFDADLPASASLTVVEALVFGRLAMGELVVEGSLHDRWRIRRDRQLIFAEDLRIEGDVSGTLDRGAVARKGRATALMLHIAPEAEGKVEIVREALREAPCEWGASAWNGMLAVRFVSPSPELQRAAILTTLGVLRGRGAPRVWQ